MNKTTETNRNKNRVLRMTALIILAMVIFVFPFAATVLADPGNLESEIVSGTKGVQTEAFEVTGYDLTAVVGKDHTYTVEEKISVNIPNQLQRVEFAIPSGNFRIGEIEVENALYEAKTASEASTVVISDPEKLSKGTHVYNIKYKIREYRDHDSAKDMFYFDVLLPEWRQPIGRVSINASFPDDFSFDDMQCYA